MRQAQRLYFKTRTRGALIDARQAEAELDTLLAELLVGDLPF